MNSSFDKLFVPTYARSGKPLVKGKGTWLFDTANKKYLDFGSGIAVNALGHSHPAIVKALKSQGAKLLHGSNLYFLQAQIDLAKLLLKHSFGDKVFLCNSGTEANEAAIKFARKWGCAQSPEKYHVLSFSDGFHGRTYGALAATAQTKFHAGFGPMPQGFHHSAFNDVEAARNVLEKHEFAAIIVEPIQGESGINIATADFLEFLRSYATKHKIALIFDEIQCGMGRTGTLFYYQQAKVTPDILALSKPLGGGLPLGAVVCTNAIAAALSPGDHGTTFGGNPLACALGTALIGVVASKTFGAKVKAKGAYLCKKLNDLAKNQPLIKEVRGKGLLVGAELSIDPKDVVPACKESGLLVIKAGHNTVRFLPPLNVSEKEIDTAVSIFAKVLKQIQ